MTDDTDNLLGDEDVASGSNSQAVLRNYIERLERLDEEKRATADSMKEVLAEAKSEGLDPKAMRAVLRLRKMDQAKRKEEEHIIDTYLAALCMLD